MAKLSYYLDTRAAKPDRAPLKLVVRHKGTSAMLPIGVTLLPEEWDGARVVKHPQRATLNTLLSRRLADAEIWLLEQRALGNRVGSTATDIRDALARLIDGDDTPDTPPPLLIEGLLSIAESKTRPNTRTVYMYTVGRIRAYDKRADMRTYQEIDRAWLDGFSAWLSARGASPNTIAVNMRCICAAFNRAIDDGRITCYPFRRYKIKTERTAKRSLSIDDLRALINAPMPTPAAQRAIDYFVLILCLIGINIADLFELSEIRQGRVEYRRAKTGRLYSIKVEPEAAALIDKLRGRTRVVRAADDHPTIIAWQQWLNKRLKRIGSSVMCDGVPVCPELTSYWARHTWATIAASLDIPKETIAAALGHGGNSVTDIYIDFDRAKIDAANRRVIDYVLYDKR